MPIRIDTSAFEASVDALIVAVRDATRMGVVAGGAEIEGVAKRLVPVLSGDLRRSITTSPAEALGPGTYSVQVEPDIVYGRIIERGGTIVPKTDGGVLSWIGPDGSRLFAKKVTIQPHPYMRPSVDISGSAVRAAITVWWHSAFR